MHLNEQPAESEEGFVKEAFSDRAGVIVFLFLLAVLAGFAVLFVDRLRADARRELSLSNLNQIALACHDHSATYGRLPAATNQGPGQDHPRSWEQEVLPFVEQSITYDQHLNLAWDLPESKHFYQQAYPELLSPHLKDKTHNSEGFALNHYAATSETIGFDGPRNIEELDPNRVMIGEIAAGFQPWGKPGNARSIGNGIWFDKTSFGNPEYNGYAYANVDGSTHYYLNERSRQRPESD